MPDELSRLLKIQLTRPVLSLTVLRVLLGHIFLVEGTGKLFGWFDHGGLDITSAYFRDIGIPFPGLSAVVVGGVEMICGALLLIGFMTRVVVIPVAVIMMTAIITVHSSVGYYYPLVLCASFFILAQSGAGRWSVDEFMSNKNMADSLRPYIKLRDRGKS